ncbi:PREDICTED: stAR-related lipid transfer protein 7, mitochondrial-like isoform X1 [Fragaria vesca subsp. vesca]|uniref:stAR-related lipid transfer protein 7, mitochondrial-like isoform X1 n=1 Tax=Fragaria vesca subsp. vesca TaxID=101020 RepID=UPI0002C33905|nr:PREDICTED: stAR-related lipid transfer protein 7, mitochondrial-like isoform X1 [Fragaria vesca subsp. vesca]
MNMIAELVLTVVYVIATALIPLVSLSLVKGCSWTWSWTSCSWTWSSSWRLPFPTLSLHDSALGRLLSCFNSHRKRIISELVSDTYPSSDQEQEPSELNEEDLRVLISHIEETDGGPPWKLMMEQSIPSLTYKAWYRDPPTGPPQYRTRTVFENVSPEILRDFFWDDEFRPRWDKMLIHSKVLSTCLQTGTMIVHWIRKLPLFCSAREYIIIRRIWESATGYYCVTKGTPYPSLPRLRRPKRVDVYHSSWCIRPVKSRNADQQTGSEVLLFHYEDIGLPKEVVKMGVRAGMWNMVKKLHLGVQIYNMEKANDESPSYYAIMAHITTKLPASPSTIMYHIPQVEADENACQNQNPEAQAIESS